MMNIQEINGLLPNYRQVKEVEIKWAIEAYKEFNGLSLIVSMSQDFEFKNNISLCFFEITDLNVSFEGGAWYPMTLDLFIIDVKNKQMEGLNYKVVDRENERISFYCKEIEWNTD